MNYEEGVKHSMSLPWTPRPSYRTKAQDTTPTGARKDRRTHKLKRAYYHAKDDFGTLVLMLALFGGGVLIWGALAGILQWLR